MKAFIPLLFSAFLLLPSDLSFAGSATWNFNPTSDDWNTANNWTPNTVPNGPIDVATFSTSAITSVSLSNDVEASEIDFSAGASAYTISLPPGPYLTISGAGLVNNSGVAQNFVTSADFYASNSRITFTNSASASSNTVFTAEGGETESFYGGEIFFEDSSSADHATFEIFGCRVYRAFGGLVLIDVDATAADATFVTYAAVDQGSSGLLAISGNAANAQITNDGGATDISGKGGNCTIINKEVSSTFFVAAGDAEQATITNEGGSFAGDYGFGETGFNGTATAGSALIVSEGGNGQGPFGGETGFFGFDGSPTAGNATLIANGGVDGGEGGGIVFTDGGDGGTARFELFGNGHLDLTRVVADPYTVTIGSLEGDGPVSLERNRLRIGSNNLSTTFSGVIQHGGSGGSLSKVGSGTLTLTGANTQTGGTTVNVGVLIASNRNGSATGTGKVNVKAGTLGGKGSIAGAVTIGTGTGSGAFLAPSVGSNQPVTLTLRKALTLKADSTYTCKLNTRNARADQVIAKGVTIATGAQFDFQQIANKRLASGTVFTVLSNTSPNAISGTFASLPDGSTFTSGRNKYQVSYEGGDGNDLTLIVVP